MKITTLENIPFSQLANCFNEGFSDYFVKFNATEDYLCSRWKGARVDFRSSAGGWVDGQLVALLVHGIDDWKGEKTAFNAGTCVAPAHRGNQFTNRAYDLLMPTLKANGVTHCRLEVIQKNLRAIKVYEKIGFEIDRGLACFGGTLKDTPIKSSPHIFFKINNSLDFRTAQSFHNFHPAWEQTLPAIQLNWKALEVFQLESEKALLAYAIVHCQTGQIFSFGVHPAHRRHGLGQALFHKIAQKHPRLKVNNIDKSATPCLNFLEKIGLENTIDQYEMGKNI